MSYFYLFFVYVSHAGYPVASICKISGHIATSTDLSPGLFGHTAHGQRLRDRAHDGDVFWDLDTPCMGLVRDVEGLRRRYKMIIKCAMVTSLLCGILGNYADRDGMTVFLERTRLTI